MAAILVLIVGPDHGLTGQDYMKQENKTKRLQNQEVTTLPDSFFLSTKRSFHNEAHDHCSSHLILSQEHIREGGLGHSRGAPLTQLCSSTMSKVLAKSNNHLKVEECCDMSFQGLSPELMLCVIICRERLWCSLQASKLSRQVLRWLLDQTAWDPNLGL